jgi:hypothetical protein
MSDKKSLEETGRCAYAAIEEKVGALDSDDDDAVDLARERIQGGPLSLQVRGGWRDPGQSDTAEEYELLLATGGPAVRIRGELDQWQEPATARLEVQDWFTPWTEYQDTDSNVLLTYVSCFYFGEG